MQIPDPIVTVRIDNMHEPETELCAVVEVGGIVVLRHAVSAFDRYDYKYEEKRVMDDASALFGRKLAKVLEGVSVESSMTLSCGHVKNFDPMMKNPKVGDTDPCLKCGHLRSVAKVESHG